MGMGGDGHGHESERVAERSKIEEFECRPPFTESQRAESVCDRKKDSRRNFCQDSASSAVTRQPSDHTVRNAELLTDPQETAELVVRR